MIAPLRVEFREANKILLAVAVDPIDIDRWIICPAVGSRTQRGAVRQRQVELLPAWILLWNRIGERESLLPFPACVQEAFTGGVQLVLQRIEDLRDLCRRVGIAPGLRAVDQ